jgi:YjbE family integral membrane protein
MSGLVGPEIWPSLIALGQVLAIDLVLAGDNAVVVGLAVAGLAAEQKRRAIALGVILAAIIRIALALVALDLLAIVGLTLAGGLLLLWVCWRMYRELRHSPAPDPTGVPAKKTLRAAITQIVLADLSMSLDNVLAVAGAAHDHPYVLVAGLAVSVLLMGLAANAIARLLDRYRWIAWIGLLIVLYVALKLIWEGSDSVIEHTGCTFLPAWVPHPLRRACAALARPGLLFF